MEVVNNGLIQEKFVLEEIREQLGLTITEFCEELDISRMAYHRYKKGEREPLFTIRTSKRLNKLLRRLGKTIDDLPDTFYEQAN